MPTRQPKTGVFVSVNMEPRLRAEIERLAHEDDGRSLSHMARILLREAIDARRDKQEKP
jgi:hypothetical protein